MTRTVLFDSPFLLGFEHTRTLIERAAKAAGESYPPYNVESIDDDHVRITLAVAGVALAVSALATPLIAFCALSVAAAALIVAPCLVWTLPSRILGGAAAAGGIGLINAIGNLGGFVAPNLRAWVDIGLNSHSAGVVGLGIMTVIGACTFAVAPRR